MHKDLKEKMHIMRRETKGKKQNHMECPETKDNSWNISLDDTKKLVLCCRRTNQ